MFTDTLISLVGDPTMPLEVRRAKQIFCDIESIVGVRDMDDDTDQIEDEDEEDMLEIDENHTVSQERSQSPTGGLTEESILVISMHSRKYIDLFTLQTDFGRGCP